MSEPKKKKHRVELRRNRTKPPRGNDLTRQFDEDANSVNDTCSGERVRAKGDISRHRTITVGDEAGAELQPGRVLRVHGLYSIVELAEGRQLKCAVRRLLKSLVTDERSIVTTGDRVWVRESDQSEGMIERVEPRHGVLTRASRRQEHVLVANVDQVVIVVSLVEPDLKPHLIDRYIAAALKGNLTPIVVLNKLDRSDAAEWQPLVGAYAQMGIPVILTSARGGTGIERLKRLLAGRASVFSGQSGVGKSSLLNAVQPGLGLRVREVSEVNQKGKHTTTTAELIRLEGEGGGWLVDTPGVRTLQLWDTLAEEVEGYFHEFRPFIARCKFPDCTHIHERGCAVRVGVQKHFLADRRYHSYVGMFRGMTED
ncbi:MAG: ribosome small subunit-dependent GTPase A [Gemmataceae bacterium]